MANQKRKSQSLLNGAMVLAAATLIVKVIGILYKIPLSNMVGAVGRGYFDSAYNLYIPIYTISMAGLPVAVSKLVSQNMALGRFRDVRLTYRVAARLFLFTGTAGTILLLLLAYPYAYLAKSMEALPAIFAITPSIFFCCIMSIYRGYYNGLRNMTPTAMSQVWEAAGKVVFGLACAKLSINYGYSRFEQGLSVYGKVCTTQAEASSAIYPYAAAAAAIGVTAGTVIGMIYMMILYKVKGDGISRDELRSAPRPEKSNAIVKALVGLAVPVVASSLVFSVTNLIDSMTIQNRLATMIEGNLDYIRTIYATQLASSNILDADIPKYLYGAYVMSLDFKNLIPSITMTLGVSAIPALSAAWALKDKKQIKGSIESVLRVTMMLSLPSGIGMGVLATPILQMLYETGKSADAVSIAAPIMAAYGYTIFLMSLSQPLTNMLQALGKAKIPLYSLTIGAVAKVIVNYVCIGMKSLNINGAVVGTVVCYTIIVVFNLVALLKITQTRINFMSVAIKPAICSILSGIGAYTSYGIANKLLPEIVKGGHSITNLVAVIIAVFFAIVIYAISMLLTDAIAKDDIIMLPKGEKIAKTLAKYGFIE